MCFTFNERIAGAGGGLLCSPFPPTRAHASHVHPTQQKEEHTAVGGEWGGSAPPFFHAFVLILRVCEHLYEYHIVPFPTSRARVSRTHEPPL